MPSVALYNMDGKEVGTIELSEKVFAVEANPAVIHEVVKNYLANQRQGTQSTKTRSEVSGGGIKPWRQKGTGRARQGSIRATQWIHGGIALGPKPRDYRYSVNKKIKRLALKAVLSAKVKEGKFVVIDNLDVSEIKTKTVAKLLNSVEAKKALIVTAEPNEKVVRSARNIEGVEISFTGAVNVYEILKADKLVIAQDAVKKLEEVYA